MIFLPPQKLHVVVDCLLVRIWSALRAIGSRPPWRHTCILVYKVSCLSCYLQCLSSPEGCKSQVVESTRGGYPMNLFVAILFIIWAILVLVNAMYCGGWVGVGMCQVWTWLAVLFEFQGGDMRGHIVRDLGAITGPTWQRHDIGIDALALRCRWTYTEVCGTKFLQFQGATEDLWFLIRALC